MSETDGSVDKVIKLSAEAAESLEYEAKGAGVPVDQYIEEMFTDGFYVAFKDVEESVVKLKYIDPWGKEAKTITPAGKEGEDSATLKTFRRLRDDFPPVSAGIEYSINFTSGGGFTVELTDPKDKHQEHVKRIINKLNRQIYQDEVTKGLDTILNIMLDEVFTVGCAAAEIVYDGFKEAGSFNFNNWVTPILDPKEGEPEYKSNELTMDQWKKMKGIVQLKIIDNAVERMKAYRNKTTYKIEYWTLDEKDIREYNQKHKNDPSMKKEIPKLLPWQVLWLSWDRRGSKLKGISMIKKVAKTALLLERILAAVGLSFQKWSDRKYFFVLGSDKTGRSWAPPKIRNFLHDVKKMTSTGGTGIAVPAGFDIKDIGGEVFEGGVILDRLITFICGGMKYPRTFLEQGKTQEGDKAWLAWIVTYATNQKLLRRAIEQQLWERHLYTVLGIKTRKIPKQGVPKEKQEEAPIFVPNMAWKSEGKWHIQQKIEQLTKILNVANPVGAELKLEVEGDMATTLGYSEMSLDNARKVLEMRQKLDVMDGEVDLLKIKVLKEALEEAIKKKEYADFLPLIVGLKEPEPEVEQPKRPPPIPLARLGGGVSRTTKQTGEPSRKGVAKPAGGTRRPEVRPSGTEETVQFNSYEELFNTLFRLREQENKEGLYMRMLEVLESMDEEV